MSVDLPGPCCACLNVKYDPIVNDDGSRSDRWQCADCGGRFERTMRPLTVDDVQDALAQGRIERKMAEGDHAWISLVKRNEALTAENERLETDRRLNIRIHDIKVNELSIALERLAIMTAARDEACQIADGLYNCDGGDLAPFARIKELRQVGKDGG